MADILIDTQGAPSTPAAGKAVIWLDSTTKKIIGTDDGGVHRGGTISKNYATAQQTGFAADTYLTGSNILIPSFGMQIGQFFQWQVCIEKTAAGAAAIGVDVRVGTNASTADTSRGALRATIVQTATASVFLLLVTALVRTVSASGVIVSSMGTTSITGPTAAQGSGDGDRIVSATFDNTALAGQFVGLSLNGGASASYTIDSVIGWLIS